MLLVVFLSVMRVISLGQVSGLTKRTRLTLLDLFTPRLKLWWRNYEKVCTLRVRMPISSDLTNPRNFITKISRYDKVVDIPNDDHPRRAPPNLHRNGKEEPNRDLQLHQPWLC